MIWVAAEPGATELIMLSLLLLRRPSVARTEPPRGTSSIICTKSHRASTITIESRALPFLKSFPREGDLIKYIA